MEGQRLAWAVSSGALFFRLGEGGQGAAGPPPVGDDVIEGAIGAADEQHQGLGY